MAGVLFPEASHRVAPASQEAFAFVREHLQEREIAVFKLGAHYCRVTGYQDFTGGELAALSGESVVSLRPRLHGLHKAGWLHRSPALRNSRVHGERRCHPYSLAISEAAIERIGK